MSAKVSKLIDPLIYKGQKPVAESTSVVVASDDLVRLRSLVRPVVLPFQKTTTAVQTILTPGTGKRLIIHYIAGQGSIGAAKSRLTLKDSVSGQVVAVIVCAGEGSGLSGEFPRAIALSVDGALTAELSAASDVRITVHYSTETGGVPDNAYIS